MKEKLFIPIILGTVRKGRYSEHVARIVHEQLQKHSEEIETELIDIREIPFDWEGEGEDEKNHEFAAKAKRADGFVIVTPEYNRSFPGSLKHALDTNYTEYRYKPAGLCSVSSGKFGGVRAIIGLLPTLKTYGLYIIRPELNFARVKDVFSETGEVQDEEAVAEFLKQMPSFFDELLKLAQALREFRNQSQ